MVVSSFWQAVAPASVFSVVRRVAGWRAIPGARAHIHLHVFRRGDWRRWRPVPRRWPFGTVAWARVVTRPRSSAVFSVAAPTGFLPRPGVSGLCT